MVAIRKAWNWCAAWNQLVTWPQKRLPCHNTIWNDKSQKSLIGSLKKDHIKVCSVTNETLINDFIQIDKNLISLSSKPISLFSWFGKYLQFRCSISTGKEALSRFLSGIIHEVSKGLKSTTLRLINQCTHSLWSSN